MSATLPWTARIESGRFARRVLIGLIMIGALVPLVFVLRIATESSLAYALDPGGFFAPITLVNFGRAWRIGNLGRGFVNSLEIVPAAALLATAVATLAGFALAKLQVPVRRFVLTLLVVAICVPVPAIVFPLFIDGLSHGYTNSKPGLSVVYASVTLAWGTWYLYSYFQSMPDSLLESARVDGAPIWRIFLHVALPIGMPAIGTLFVFNVFFLWSDLLLAVVMLLSPNDQTVTVGTALLDSQITLDAPLKAAGVLIAVAPNAILFLAAQRVLRKNVLSGASKE